MKPEYAQYVVQASLAQKALQQVDRDFPGLRTPLADALTVTKAVCFLVQGPRELDPVRDDNQDNSKCRALLLDIVRRAIHDFVLYRDHKSLDKREIADHARIYLFEEGPGHEWWKIRQGTPLECLSLIAICETLDYSVEKIRTMALRTTPQQVLSSGRPPERRRRQQEDDVLDGHHGVGGLEVDTLDRIPGYTHYEDRFTVVTYGSTG